jgi:hypothetical protein
MRRRRISAIVVAIGLTLLVAAPIVWRLSQRSPVAGDVGAIEQALRGAIDGAPKPRPTAPTAAPEPQPSVPSTEGVAEPTTTPTTTPPIPRPAGLRINAIDVDAPVNPYGVAANGDMDVPDNVTDVGWYEFGPRPGESGSAVLAAHVDLAGQGPGVFFDLEDLDPGDLVTIVYEDDSTQSFRVAARVVYDKEEIPLDVIFAEDGPPVLTLITCGGGFNRQIRRYDSNVVVYALPEGATPSVTLPR